MIVADASALVDALLRRGGEAVEVAVLGAAGTIHVPHLADLELLQALRGLLRRRLVEPERAEEMMEDFADLPLVRHPHYPYAGRIWQLRDRLSAYDAAYATLAEALNLTLVTRDRGLASAASGFARVQLV